ncbi:MAG: LLM class F420-dependent oxidoreductase [Gammaproteobacteria bacterium]
MELWTTYPVTDVGCEPETLRTFAQGVEDAGYAGMLLSEHVLGVDPAQRPGWRPYNPFVEGPGDPVYDHTHPFLDPFVAFGFLASVTRRIRLGTGVMVLGMRQAPLVAKQAAIADVLTGGRIMLGVGSGWNDVEYEAMGVDFHSRGKRIDEQIALLRALWTQGTVDFQGRWHTVKGAGINPPPVQRPIPLWIGGTAAAAVRRAALLGDGYYPGGLADDAGAARLERMRALAREAGRDPDAISIMGAVTQGPREPERLVRGVEKWQRLGATHCTVRTSTHPIVWRADLPQAERSASAGRYLDALRRFKAAWDNR